VDKDVAKGAHSDQVIDFIGLILEIKISAGLHSTTRAILAVDFYTDYVDNVVRKDKNRSEEP
jgi:hypothetical protein